MSFNLGKRICLWLNINLISCLVSSFASIPSLFNNVEEELQRATCIMHSSIVRNLPYYTTSNIHNIELVDTDSLH